MSILTPAFNSAAFLGETVRSVLEQTFTDFELLIVDDASSDDTLEAAQQLASADDRVRVRSVLHGGPALARNAAMADARGRLFALLDSDDMWMPWYLEEQVDLIDSFRSASIITANAINLGGDLDGRPIWPVSPGVTELRLLDLIAREDSVCIMTLFRRDVVDRIGGFDARFTGNEDYHFWLRAAAAGFQVLQNGEPLGFYRRRAGSLSANEERLLRGLMAVLMHFAASRGLRPSEREAIERQLERFRRQLVRACVRDCLERHDAHDAARTLRAMSDEYGSRIVALAASAFARWPQLVLRLYDLRRALKSSGASRRRRRSAVPGTN